MTEQEQQALGREDVKRRYPDHAEEIDAREVIEQERQSEDPTVQALADIKRRHGKKGADGHDNT